MAKEENIIYTIYYSLKCLAVIPVVMYFFFLAQTLFVQEMLHNDFNGKNESLFT